MMQVENQDTVIQIEYIKEGLERKIFTTLQDAFLSKEAYELKEEQRELVIPKEIEWLHLKDFNFQNISTIECLNPETILVLEQCLFLESTQIKNGNIVVESLQFNHPEGNSLPYNLKFCNNERVELNLGNTMKSNAEKNIYHLSSVKHLKLTGNASQSIIYNEDSITKKMNSIELENVKEYFSGAFYAEEVKIENSELGGLEYICYNHLEIKNTTVQAPSSRRILDLRKGSLEMKNVTLFGETIYLPEKEFHPMNGKLFVADLKDKKEDLLLARQQLVSCLKERQKKIESTPQKISFPPKMKMLSFQNHQMSPYFTSQNPKSYLQSQQEAMKVYKYFERENHQRLIKERIKMC